MGRAAGGARIRVRTQRERNEPEETWGRGTLPFAREGPLHTQVPKHAMGEPARGGNPSEQPGDVRASQVGTEELPRELRVFV